MPLFARVYACDLESIPSNHPVQYLRGCRTLGVASPDINDVTIGAEVVVLSRDEFDRLCGVQALPFGGEG